MICTRCKKETHNGTHMEEGLVCYRCVNREKYDEGREDFFLCGICGEADSPDNWLGNVLEEDLCFSCSFWVRHIYEYRNGKKVVIDGNMYSVGVEVRERFAFKGFGGRQFEIQMKDSGKSFITSNLWHNGQVPDRFREKLPDNAVFITDNEVISVSTNR